MVSFDEAREDIRLESTCSCGARRDEMYAHILRRSGRTVHVSSYCPGCGARQEAELPELPERVVQAILREQGTWGLSVSGGASDRALLVLRRALGLSLTQVSMLKKQTGPIVSGTRVQMTSLRDMLRSEGILAEVHLQ